MLSNRLRDLAGFAFFSFAAVVSGAAACEHPSLLVWLYAFHNLLLAWLYTRRLPAERYDRCGSVVGDDCSFAAGYSIQPGCAMVSACARSGRIWVVPVGSDHPWTAFWDRSG